MPQAREEFERELQLDPKSVYSNFFSEFGSHGQRSQEGDKLLIGDDAVNPLSWRGAFASWPISSRARGPRSRKSLRRSIELTTDVSRNSYQIKKAHFILGRLLLKAGRQAEAEKELAIAKELQATSLESSRQELGDILGQVVKPGEEITAPSQVATAVSNGPEDNKDIGKGSMDDVLLIEESAPDTQQAARFRRVKEELSEIWLRLFIIWA